MTSRPKSDKKKSDPEEFEVLDVRETAKDAENLLRQIRKYLSKGSNSQQLAIGGVSGWVTGYMAMKIGKTVATAVGGSLILLQIAAHKGYININWSKVNKDLEGASRKLAQSGSDPSVPQLLDKAANYLDEQAEKAGRVLRKNKQGARRWYHRFVYGKDQFELQPIHIFYMGFAGGCLAGTVTGIVL